MEWAAQGLHPLCSRSSLVHPRGVAGVNTPRPRTLCPQRGPPCTHPTCGRPLQGLEWPTVTWRTACRTFRVCPAEVVALVPAASWSVLAYLPFPWARGLPVPQPCLSHVPPLVHGPQGALPKSLLTLVWFSLPQGPVPKRLVEERFLSQFRATLPAGGTHFSSGPGSRVPTLNAWVWLHPQAPASTSAPGAGSSGGEEAGERPATVWAVAWIRSKIRNGARVWPSP